MGYAENIAPSLSTTKNTDVLFVDFFDTLMFRHTHPLQIKKRWAELITTKYRALSRIQPQRILNMRSDAERGFLQEEHHEIDYSVVMERLFAALLIECPELARESDKKSFVLLAHLLECAVECGAQYPNTKFIKFLHHKSQEGAKIFIVSDFYLGKDDLIGFMRAKSIDVSIFSGVYVSCDHDARKSGGKLYQLVLQKVGMTADQVKMFGDNPTVDGKAARASGLRTKLNHNYYAKISNQFCRAFEIDFSKRAFKQITKDCYRYNAPFAEYITIFYLFTRELYSELHNNGSHQVIFFSREGLYLKNLFDFYESLLIPSSERIRTLYFKASRHSVLTVQPVAVEERLSSNISLEDYLQALGFSRPEINAIRMEFGLSIRHLTEIVKDIHSEEHCVELFSTPAFRRLLKCRLDESTAAFREYASSFIKEETVNFVDVGWRGTLQQSVAKFMGIASKGYYIGIQGDLADVFPIERKGIIFHEGRTKHYSILRANTQLYEQLLAAPHGSARRYSFDDKKEVVVEEEWAENERQLFHEFIENMQKEMIMLFGGLCAWCESFPFAKGQQVSANTVLRSSLFADKERLKFLNALDAGFVGNFGRETKGLSFNRKAAVVNWRILSHPHEYVRYFAKIQRSVPNNKLLRTLYYPFAWLLYAYIRIMMLLIQRSGGAGRVARGNLPPALPQIRT